MAGKGRGLVLVSTESGPKHEAEFDRRPQT